MNLKYLFPLVAFILLILFIYSFLDKTTDKEAYLEEIASQRQEIINFMQSDPDSPFQINDNVKFEGLNFFDIDPGFRVKAEIKKISSPIPFDIKMSDGETAEYFKYAIAHFTLNGIKQELFLLKSKQFYDEPWLFLPFYDETSAIESYGGGRYLNLEYNGEEEIYIDFNLAYNPYCAYSGEYRCPIPPFENHVTVKVTAGERSYQKHQ